jgi:hypothetical protein
VLDRPGRNGERLVPSGSFSLRIYRLSRRGTTAASAALFETLESDRVSVSEGRSRGGPSELFLRGRPTGCSRATASQRRRRRVPRLRARSRGRNFRTRTPSAAATARGTDWTISERCEGTLVTVRRGTVSVRDIRRRRTVRVRAGRSYLARRR